MSSTISCGIDSVECPGCKALIDLTDASIDGCLEPGYKYQCQECKAKLVIDAIDWEPTIYASIDGEPPL